MNLKKLWLAAAAGTLVLVSPAASQSATLTKAEQHCAKTIGDQGGKVMCLGLKALDKCQDARNKGVAGAPCDPNEPGVHAVIDKVRSLAEARINGACAGVNVQHLGYPVPECPEATNVAGVNFCLFHHVVSDPIGFHEGLIQWAFWGIFWLTHPNHATTTTTSMPPPPSTTTTTTSSTTSTTHT